MVQDSPLTAPLDKRFSMPPAPAGGRPAHVWHSQRRQVLMKHPGVRTLLREGSGGCLREVLIDLTVCASVITFHYGTAIMLKRLADNGTTPMYKVALALILLAITSGAQCAYLLQALNHEMSHAARALKVGGQTNQIIRFAGCFLGVCGAALCHVPWAAYYYCGGHHRHHIYTGSPRDVDGDALFYLWSPTMKHPFIRFLWASVAAVMVPVSYFYSLALCTIKGYMYVPWECVFFGMHVAFKIAIYYFLGRTAFFYFLLSSWCSMGFMCHPLIGFWLLQHLCVDGDQPTVSYYGSRIWNFLTLNELLHAEHHDLAGISWRHLPKLREIAPEMYEKQHYEMSLFTLIKTWLKGDTPHQAWDFECRAKWRADSEAEYMKKAIANGMLRKMLEQKGLTRRALVSE